MISQKYYYDYFDCIIITTYCTITEHNNGAMKLKTITTGILKNLYTLKGPKY